MNIAVATYEMIDKHIRKLDSDLAKFESEMKVVFNLFFASSPLCPGQRSDVSDGERGGGGGEQEEDEGQEEEGSEGGGEQQEEEESKEGETNSNLTQSHECSHCSQVENLTTPLISYVGSGVPQEVLDMPVDPNEPTYCTCQQVKPTRMDPLRAFPFLRGLCQ